MRRLLSIVTFVFRPVDRGDVCHRFDLFVVYFNCILLQSHSSNISSVGSKTF